MPSVLTRLLKATLPPAAIDLLLDVRDSMRLRAVPRQQFVVDTLRSRAGFDLTALLADVAAAEGWRMDHGEISAIFGDSDKFAGVNPGDRRALYHLVRTLRPRRVLEVGTHIGASTLYIARALRANGNDGRVTTVDITDVNDPQRGAWRAVGQRKAPREFAAELGVSDRITFVVSDSVQWLGESGDPFDLVFLDGDHASRAVYQEVSRSLRRLAPGGVILLHDFYPGGVALFPDGGRIRGPHRAMVRIAREAPAVGVLPLGALPWETKQGSRMTSLALVVRER
jgi:predicted O-methyltransferase YrrM